MLSKNPAGENGLKSFRSRYEYIWRAAGLSSAFLEVGVSMTDSEFYVEVVAPPLQSFHHVPIQGAQWSYVKNFDTGRLGRLKEHAENWEKSGFSFAGGCWGN